MLKRGKKIPRILQIPGSRSTPQNKRFLEYGRFPSSLRILLVELYKTGCPPVTVSYIYWKLAKYTVLFIQHMKCRCFDLQNIHFL
jgi:hypothetical protein